jgi:hypothetical protein
VPIASEAAQKGEAADAVEECEEWRGALNEGDYDYLIAGPDQRTQSLSPIEAAWTGTDPAARELEETDDVFVFELTGQLDPAGCPEIQPPAAPQ